MSLCGYQGLGSRHAGVVHCLDVKNLWKIREDAIDMLAF